MNEEPILIGADVGTTNIKAVAFDTSGRALEGASSPTPTRFPRPGRAHYDPEELWNSFAATGLPESTGVAAGGQDHVCGALTAGVTQKGTMLDSLGTAEAIFLPLERPLTDPRVGHQGYTQGAHVAGQYYALGGQYTSGASV